MKETWVWSLGWDDPLGKKMATYSSTLAWEIPRTEEPGGLATVHRAAKNRTRLSDWLSLSFFQYICIYAFFVAVIANDTFKIKRFLFLLIFYKFHLWKMNIGKISSNKENCPPNLKKYTISHHYTLLLLFSGQSCLTLCDPMDYSTPGHTAPHHLPEFAQVLVHCIGDGIQPSHPLTPSSSALNLS